MTFIPRRAALAFLGAVCAAAPAAAGDWSAYNERILGDPSFLPVAGQVEGTFSYTYAADLFDGVSPDPFRGTTSNDRSSNAFLPTLRYGITDDISVFANLGFGNSRNVQDQSFQHVIFGIPIRVVHEQARVSYHSLGADDPVFGATWRVVDQRFAPVNVDLTGSYTPDIFQSRDAERLQTGTFASGGQEGSVDLTVSREMRFLTLQVYGTFSYAGRRNEIADDGYGDLRSAPHPIYSAGFEGQARLLPWLAVDAGVNASQAVQYDRPLIFRSFVNPETLKPDGTINPYAGIVVPLLGRNVVGQAFYNHFFNNDEAIDTPFGQLVRYEKSGGNNYQARILVAFGGAPAPIAPPSAAAAMAPPAPLSARTYLVFFDWDRADLTSRARQIVAEAAAASTHVQTTRIEVNGYTDLSGTAAYNRRLSVRRAETVEAELVRDGVSREEIGIHGYGESNPLVPTAAGVREPQNRRVEIILQ